MTSIRLRDSDLSRTRIWNNFMVATLARFDKRTIAQILAEDWQAKIHLSERGEYIKFRDPHKMTLFLLRYS